MIDLNHNVTTSRAALVVAHPGHELVVHHWLEVAQPKVFVLTDGSGRSQQSRVNSTSTILDNCGARSGEIYGRLTDVDAYTAILDHDFGLFIGLARELSEALVADQINLVAGDALEGYNPMHDVCRLLVNTAVIVARKTHGHEITNLEFSLTNPDTVPEETPAKEIWLRLDSAALTRKISAAHGYDELAGEVHNALGRASVEGFRVERLRPVDPAECARRFANELPFYEHHGAQRVEAGHYHRVLRYHEHIVPLADALSRFSEQ